MKVSLFFLCVLKFNVRAGSEAWRLGSEVLQGQSLERASPSLPSKQLSDWLIIHGHYCVENSRSSFPILGIYLLLFLRLLCYRMTN